MKVYKNSLAQRAASEVGAEELTNDLVGPNALVFGPDAVAPARILAELAKKHEKLVLKSGIVEGKVVGVETIKELAGLPNREGMLSMLLSCLQSPIRSFACVVKAVADKQSEGEAPAEEAAA
jgi:large subunit ribosomal protein L10